MFLPSGFLGCTFLPGMRGLTRSQPGEHPGLQQGAGAGEQAAPSPLTGADARSRAPPSLRAMENPTCSYIYIYVFFFSSNNFTCGFHSGSVQALSSPVSRAELTLDSGFSQSALINTDCNRFQWLWILPVHT